MNEQKYTRADMARAWEEGAGVAWANTTPQWNGHTHAPQFLPFREANYDIDNPYELDEDCLLYTSPSPRDRG